MINIDKKNENIFMKIPNSYITYLYELDYFLFTYLFIYYYKSYSNCLYFNIDTLNSALYDSKDKNNNINFNIIISILLMVKGLQLKNKNVINPILYIKEFDELYDKIIKINTIEDIDAIKNIIKTNLIKKYKSINNFSKIFFNCYTYDNYITDSNYTILLYKEFYTLINSSNSLNSKNIKKGKLLNSYLLIKKSISEKLLYFYNYEKKEDIDNFIALNNNLTILKLINDYKNLNINFNLINNYLKKLQTIELIKINKDKDLIYISLNNVDFIKKLLNYNSDNINNL